MALLLGLGPPSEPARGDPIGSVARIADPGAARARLGLSPGYDPVDPTRVKVAVLDYGFAGVGGSRRYLPEGTVVVEDYDPAFVRRFGLGAPDYRKPFEPGNRHGRDMAQIVWAASGSHRDGPRFYLLNANGPTMLRRAVRYAIEGRVDLILFSGSFEGGGNGDGKGFINRVADEALAAGIIWINAAGNYGGRVFSGPVRVLPDGFLRLRDGADVAALRLRNRLDENDVTITLTWDDYRESEDAGTTKDLDLSVEDWTGRVIGTGDKVQVEADRPLAENETRNPRERVVLNSLAACPVVTTDPDFGYRIRVKVRHGRFTADDRLRILVTATKDVYVPPGSDRPEDAVVLLDATGEEEIYPPADNPRVLTVGDATKTSSLGPTLDRRVKPDLLIEDSRAYFTDGEVSSGSSNAAAYFAGVVAVLKAAEPRLEARHLVRLARKGNPIPEGGPPGTPRDSRARPPLETNARGRAAARLGLKLWTTPTRAALAEAVRGGRDR